MQVEKNHCTSGPIVGPWAARAHWLGMSILQGQWACPMPGWACPMPGWACPMPRLGMSHVQVVCLGPIWGPILCLGTILVQFGNPCFVWGPFWVPFALGPIGGPWDQVGGSVRPLEAECRVLGSEPRGTWSSLACPAGIDRVKCALPHAAKQGWKDPVLANCCPLRMLYVASFAFVLVK